MLLWLDLETTGIDPKTDLILETGWTITTDDFQPHLADDKGNDVVTNRVSSFTPNQLDLWMRSVDPIVLNMHSENGLWKDILQEQGTMVIGDIEDQILSDIAAGVDDDVKPILAGSGVHFDQNFIKENMPRLADRIHYHIFDVSTLERFFSLCGLTATRVTESTVTPHRAGNDVILALDKARMFYNAGVQGLAIYKVLQGIG